MEMQAQAPNENAAENEQEQAMEDGGEVGPQSIDVLQVRAGPAAGNCLRRTSALFVAQKL